MAGGQVRRLGRLLRAPVRARGWRPRRTALTAADACASPSRAPAAGSAGRCRGARRTRRSPGSRGPIAWTRADFDLDAPGPIHALLDRDRPEAVVNAAAWTDVDGCARDPELALPPERRGGRRARRGDGRPRHRPRPHQHERGLRRPADRRAGIRAGRRDEPDQSVRRLEAGRRGRGGCGLRAARPAPASLGIVRTAWLYGPPGNDFPAKILAAAERARAAGEPLRVVGDEFGSPTFTHDVAEAVVGAARRRATSAGVHHVVNGGRRVTGGLGARAVPPGRAGRRDRGGAGIDLGARLDAAGLGRARADAAARRRAAPRLARGARRLPADAAAAARAGR